jgi:DNA invertase Pin-like site-specific DNA recombinase
MSELVALYLRVSTVDQDLAGQERELRQYATEHGWEVAKVYAEKASATGRVLREAYEQLLEDAKRKPGWSRVVVWALDRWSRDPSFVQAIGSIEELEALGIEFHSMKEPWVDTAKEGETGALARDLLRGILPTISAFEARRRSDRTRVAMQEIRSGARPTRSGRPPGRPVRVTREKLEEIATARKAGKSWREVAQAVGLPRGTCARAFRRSKMSPGHRQNRGVGTKVPLEVETRG